MTTSLPAEQVQAVYFFVDHDRWWADSSTPYTFGPDGAYLATRWLSGPKKSRMHEFKVRVVAKDGERWSEALRVRTPPAEVVPGTPGLPRTERYYYGEYGRLSPADVADPPSPGKWPSFTGFIAFGTASLFVPGKRDYAWELSADRRRLHLATPIYVAMSAHVGTGGVKALETVLCAVDGPPATYTWVLTRGRVTSTFQGKNYYARHLELRAVKEPCAERRRLLEGVWEEIDPG